MLRSTFVPLALLSLLCCATTAGGRQADGAAPEEEGFVFTPETTIPCTPVKNQARTGTCWDFATTSFLEAELMRLGKGRYDLSEMFAVRHTYPRKARHYVRLHGNATLGPGSLAQDLLRVFREVGAVPEAVYPGRLAGHRLHNHGEMDAVLRGMLDAVVANRGGSLSPVWEDAVGGVLDAYLGEVPVRFTHGGTEYTPRSFADSLGLDPDAYVEFTSFTHRPFDRRIALEVPDNWAGNLSWNIPLDELMEIMRRSLGMGYTVAWDGDVSEHGFQGKRGVALLPAKAWDERTSEEQSALGEAPEPELVVSQELRQRQFDDYRTTDDHLMHVVGTARDQKGTLYFTAKNSAGTLHSERDGYVYLSKAYVRAKTISILVHRDVVPARIAQRLGLGERDE